MNGLLLDSHVFIWLLQGSSLIPAYVADRLADPAERPCLSVASIWELCIKAALGKLTLPPDVAASPEEGFREALRKASIELLPVQIHHATAVLKLPHHHGDPFDRMMIAQAIEENFTLVTADKVFERYEALKLLKV